MLLRNRIQSPDQIIPPRIMGADDQIYFHKINNLTTDFTD